MANAPRRPAKKRAVRPPEGWSYRPPTMAGNLARGFLAIAGVESEVPRPRVVLTWSKAPFLPLPRVRSNWLLAGIPYQERLTALLHLAGAFGLELADVRDAAAALDLADKGPRPGPVNARVGLASGLVSCVDGVLLEHGNGPEAVQPIARALELCILLDEHATIKRELPRGFLAFGSRKVHTAIAAALAGGSRGRPGKSKAASIVRAALRAAGYPEDKARSLFDAGRKKPAG